MYRHFDRILIRRFVSIVSSLPMQIRTFHGMTGPDASAFGLTLPMVLAIPGLHIRHRFVLHAENDRVIVNDLVDDYGMDHDAIEAAIFGTDPIEPYLEWLGQQQRRAHVRGLKQQHSSFVGGGQEDDDGGHGEHKKGESPATTPSSTTKSGAVAAATTRKPRSSKMKMTGIADSYLPTRSMPLVNLSETFAVVSSSVTTTTATAAAGGGTAAPVSLNQLA